MQHSFDALHSLVTCIYFFAPNMLFFTFFFVFSLHPVLIFICPHGSRRSFVLLFFSSLFFFSFIYSRCCTFAPHKANKFIYPSLPIFFVYLF
jgi:hypothetical protein